MAMVSYGMTVLLMRSAVDVISGIMGHANRVFRGNIVQRTSLQTLLQSAIAVA